MRGWLRWVPGWLSASWAALAASGGGCVAVSGDRILAADLARVIPAFAAIPPDEALGYAPAPGVRRILGAAELSRLAARHGVAVEGIEVCVERAAERLTAERVLEALRKSLAREQARIELVDFSRYPVPAGELEFPLSGLSAPPAGVTEAAVVWRGRLRYDGTRSLPVWARVRIRVSGERLVAVENLAPGQPVAPSQVRVEQGEWFPFTEAPLTRVEDAVGKLPRRSIRAGSVLYARMLASPREVERGQRVSVEVSSGAAQLKFTAVAENGGRLGDTILVRSPVNGRKLAARVAGPGKAVVDADSLERFDRGPGGGAGR